MTSQEITLHYTLLQYSQDHTYITIHHTEIKILIDRRHTYLYLPSTIQHVVHLLQVTSHNTSPTVAGKEHNVEMHRYVRCMYVCTVYYAAQPFSYTRVIRPQNLSPSIHRLSIHDPFIHVLNWKLAIGRWEIAFWVFEGFFLSFFLSSFLSFFSSSCSRS